MKKNLHTCLCFMVLLLFWGFFYPQYALTGDMYRVTQDGQEIAKTDVLTAYEELLSAKPGEVELRFSWLETMKDRFGEDDSKGCRHEELISENRSE